MTPEQFIKKHKINKVYAYAESRVDKNKVEFGWVNTELKATEGKFVVSYASRAKGIEERDIEFSKSEGKNLITLSDYETYFQSLTGKNPTDFLEKWDGKEKVLYKFWRDKYPVQRHGEPKFLMKLARLATTGKQFTFYGRIFKIIEDET